MRRAALAAEVVEALCLALWVGGLVALGAFAAPHVFGDLSDRHEAASLMTAIFRGFDHLVLVVAALVAMAEAVRLWSGAGGWLSHLRLGLAVLLVGCGATSSLWISPRIERFLLDGVRRGVGDEGASLDTWHHAAETVAKAEVVLGLVLLGLIVVAAVRRGPDADESARRLSPKT